MLNSRYKLFFTILLIQLTALPTQAGWFEPGNYDECIDAYVQKAELDYAARVLTGICGKHFSRTSPPTKKEIRLYKCIESSLPEAKTKTMTRILFKRCKEKTE